jgi:hypothetical protein
VLNKDVCVGPPQAIFDLGIKTNMKHLGIQLFVAGIISQIQDELIKDMPGVLWELF